MYIISAKTANIIINLIKIKPINANIQKWPNTKLQFNDKGLICYSPNKQNF